MEGIATSDPSVSHSCVVSMVTEQSIKGVPFIKHRYLGPTVLW